MDYSKDDNIKKIKKYKSKTKKVKNKVGLLIFRIIVTAVLVGGFAGAGAVLGAYLAVINDTPTNFELFVIEPSKYSSIIVDRSGNEIGRFTGEEKREYVDFEDVPQHLKDAFVAIEDERFYSHNGIDLRSIARVFKVLFTTGDVQGASTITQQVIKNNITKVTHNSIESKLREQYLAVRYEEFLSEKLGSKKAAKDYILGVYMNSISMHHGLYGVQTAANYYFGKDVSELTLSEAAVLAGITNKPARYAPDVNPEKNRVRQETILEKMLERGLISEKEHDDALDDDVYSRVGAYSLVMDDTPSYHTFYEDQIFESVLKDLKAIGYDEFTATNLIYSGGIKIVSAQDLSIQKIVDDAYADDENFPAKDFELDVLYRVTIQNTVTGQVRNIEKEKTVKSEEEADEYVKAVKEENLGPNDVIQADRLWITPQPQSAFVVMDYYTGQVKAIAGGRGEKTDNRAFNRATKATRSPGSVFKVLASYAPAIDMGLITPATVIDDVPFIAGKYAPSNWYTDGYRGYSSVRSGITNSMNVITVKNMYNTGVDNCFEYLLNFGFKSLVDQADAYGRTDRGLSTALGGLTYGVTQVELAAAYGAIANGGYYNEPIFYTQVFDRNGELLLDNTLQPRQVLKATSSYLLTNMMQGVLTDQGATGGKARFKEIKMPIAGKTGTTSDDYDLMFVGYTPYYVASVWLGFDKQKSIEHSSGHHLLLWSKIMEEIHHDLPYKEFEKPDGIVSAQVCRYSGKLPVMGLCDCDPRGSAIRTEIFASGTVPTESCDIHAAVETDTSTGMRANPYCPLEVREAVIGILRDPENAGKSKDSVYEVNPNGEYCTFHNMFNSDVIPTNPNAGEVPTDLDIFNTNNPVNNPSVPTPTPAPWDNREIPDGLPVNPSRTVPTPHPSPTPTPTPRPDITPVPNYEMPMDLW